MNKSNLENIEPVNIKQRLSEKVKNYDCSYLSCPICDEDLTELGYEIYEGYYIIKMCCLHCDARFSLLYRFERLSFYHRDYELTPIKCPRCGGPNYRQKAQDERFEDDVYDSFVCETCDCEWDIYTKCSDVFIQTDDGIFHRDRDRNVSFIPNLVGF